MALDHRSKSSYFKPPSQFGPGSPSLFGCLLFTGKGCHLAEDCHGGLASKGAADVQLLLRALAHMIFKIYKPSSQFVELD